MAKRSSIVSLSCELDLVLRTIDAARLLTENWKEHHFTEEQLPRLAHAMHAMLVLVRERLVLLDRGVRDTLDPRHLLCPENEAFEEEAGEDGDVLLRGWSAKKEAAKLRENAQRAERRVEALRQRRQAKEPAR